MFLYFLLCGDPVSPGELIATPSGNRLGRIEVCLLDVAPDAQRARLIARGDDPAYRPDVITGGGWEGMRWERWVGSAAECPWTRHVVDTAALSPDEVAPQVLAWVRARIGGGR